MDTEITHAKHIAIICWNRLIHTGSKKFPYSSLLFIDWTSKKTNWCSLYINDITGFKGLHNVDINPLSNVII